MSSGSKRKRDDADPNSNAKRRKVRNLYCQQIPIVLQMMIMITRIPMSTRIQIPQSQQQKRKRPERNMKINCDHQIYLRFGQTSLHQACYAGDIKIIKMLLNHTDINVKQLNKNGQEAIPVHFEHGATGYKNIEIVKLLLDKGCNPTIQDIVEDKCMNVFHRLCEASKDDEFLDNIKLILDIEPRYEYDLEQIKNALNTKDKSGKTPIDYANGK